MNWLAEIRNQAQSASCSGQVQSVRQAVTCSYLSLLPLERENLTAENYTINCKMNGLLSSDPCLALQSMYMGFAQDGDEDYGRVNLSLIHISEPTRRRGMGVCGVGV